MSAATKLWSGVAAAGLVIWHVVGGVTVASPSSERAAFSIRAAQPGVVRSWKFQPGDDLSGYIDGGWDHADGPPAKPNNWPTVDPLIGGLRFRIPSLSPANQAGSFSINFTPASRNFVESAYPVQFGEGQEFWVQWRQRFDASIIALAAGHGKVIIIGEGDRPGEPAFSCTNIEVVMVNSRGYPRQYHSCGGKNGGYEGLDERLYPYNPEQYRQQNGVRNCLWNGDQRGCVRFVANEWMTLMVHIKIGTWFDNRAQVYRNDSWIEAWLGSQAQPMVLFHSVRDYDLANDKPAKAKFGKVWFTPYRTGKDPTHAEPESFVWIDEIIVSTQPILDPATGRLPPAVPAFGDMRWLQNGSPGRKR